jgi:alkanesulfonate monooxygenase SsuD/methylene tetrahydromethanopterin reductase-like flavin-dependent oxidoreductase (luciferase family)
VTRALQIGFKTSPQSVSWATLDETWAAAGDLHAFDSAWMNDHLTDPGRDRGGASLEAVTVMAALAHHVPGMWLGHAVLSATFRHPAILAKQATVLDHASGGRFIVGLGAGWHEGEHATFGIPLPPMRERFDRFESQIHVLRSLFSAEAGSAAGVTRPDPFYPLAGATNEPAPSTPGGPPIWLGGQKTRGLRLAADLADGWLLPAGSDGLPEFVERREAIVRRFDETGRDGSAFAFAAQVATGESVTTRRAALAAARAYIDAGATDVILGIPARLGAEALEAVASEIAAPLRDAAA